MIRNNSFSWYDEITETIEHEIPPDHDWRLAIQFRSTVVSTYKLVQAIEKYGIDTRDKYDSMIIGLRSITCDTHLIDIVMRYKPNFIVGGYVLFPSFSNQFYIMRKVIENDDDYKYNRYPYKCGRVVYNTLLEYLERVEIDLIRLYRDDGIEYDYNRSESHMVTLVNNHMMKGDTLFEKMLKLTDLVKVNKRRRFH